MADSQGNGDSRVKIKLLEKDVETIGTILNKLDSALTNLNDLTNEVRRITDAHKYMIETNMKDVEGLKKYFDGWMEELENKLKNNMESHEKRISKLEGWKYYITGAIAVLGMIAGYVIKVGV